MNENLLYFLNNLDNELLINPDVITGSCIECVGNIISACVNESTKTREIVERKFVELATINNPYYKIFFLSAAVYVNYSVEVLEQLLDYCLSGSFLRSVNALFYIYEQIFHMVFKYPKLGTVSVKVKIWKLLDSLVKKYTAYLGEVANYIEPKNRNSKLVFVITDQFIEFGHGPTKTAADRCKILIEKMGKTVLLINTAECLSVEGEIPLFNKMRAQYRKDLISMNSVEWQGTIIPYFQCNDNMPNYRDVLSIVSMVQKYKPSYVVSIGGNGLTSNIISQMLPMITVGLCPSDIAPTLAACQTISYDMGEKEKMQLDIMDIPEYHLIKSVFTSSIEKVKTQIERRTIGISDNSVVLVVVGARLNIEIDYEFIDMLKKIKYDEIEIVLLGIIDEDFIYKECGDLKSKIHCVGYVRDVLSYVNICDLYVNPKRKGGGTSCVEAMSLGLPVVTLSDGDVATNAGGDFCVENYDEMAEKITEYCVKKEYYKRMSEVAKKRVAVLLDSETEFSNTIQEFEKRIDTFNL